MINNVKNIIGLPVETQSGQNLGRVSDINLEIENHVVHEYVIKHGFLNSKEFLIKPVQIVKITKEKMIVDDNLVKTIKTEDELEVGNSKLLANVSQITRE